MRQQGEPDFLITSGKLRIGHRWNKGFQLLVFGEFLFLAVTYMSVLVEKMKPIQIHCQDAGRLDRRQATAVDIKEGRAEHGEGADQTCCGGLKRDSGMSGHGLDGGQTLGASSFSDKTAQQQT